MRYHAYLSGLDMLIAIALMLPFIFLFAYSVHNGNANLQAYAEGVLKGISSNARLQEVMSLEWQNATAFGMMLNEAIGNEYHIAKAPAEPSGRAPKGTTRLAVIDGNVYYVESG